MSVASANASFTDRLCGVSTMGWVEGGLWGLFLGYQIKELNSRAADAHEVNSSSDTGPNKVARVWEANKELVIGSVLTLSAVSIFASWMNEVSIIDFGSLLPYISGLGYIGYAMTSPIKVWDAVRELGQGAAELQKTTCPLKRHELGLKHFDSLLNIAVQVSFVAWGILGLASITVGGIGLALLFESICTVSFLLMIARLGYAILFLPAKKQEKSSATS